MNAGAMRSAHVLSSRRRLEMDAPSRRRQRSVPAKAALDDDDDDGDGGASERPRPLCGAARWPEGAQAQARGWLRRAPEDGADAAALRLQSQLRCCGCD
jgi:hypothetical protein